MLIKNLSFAFSQDAPLFFNALSATITPHTVNFIEGDNGIGKSTLLQILQDRIGQSSKLEATVILDGVTYKAEHNHLPKAFTDQVHTVCQDYNSMIADTFTFHQNVQLAAIAYHPTLQKLPKAQYLALAQELKMPLDRPAYVLSGGQRQLLAILMALQKPTKLLVLDEPTATLDTKNAHIIMQCLVRLAKELHITLLIICHDKQLVNTYGQSGNLIMKLSENGERMLHRTSL